MYVKCSECGRAVESSNCDVAYDDGMPIHTCPDCCWEQDVLSGEYWEDLDRDFDDEEDWEQWQ